MSVARGHGEGEARLLLLISTPRAGSNNFERLLQSFERVETFGEVFHPTDGMDSHKSGAFLDFLGVDYAKDPSCPRAIVRSVVRADPVGACADLLRMASARGAVVAETKLFEDFLPPQVLEAVMRRYRPVCIRLHRAPIDAFISFQKARMVGTWKLVDTTELKPRISARRFGFWRWKQQNFYRMAGYLMARNGITPLDVSYDDFYRDGGDVGHLQQSLAQHGLDIGPQGPCDPLFRQDRARDRAEKVANWDSFLADYCRYGSERGLTSWDLDGFQAALWSQMQAERVVPHESMRRIASRIYPYARKMGAFRR